MAGVYSATVRGVDGFEKPVALKRIHDHLSTDVELVSMMVSEAKLCASLHHKNIVQTFDLGCIDGAYFIVMEEVDGFDLSVVLASLRRRGVRLPWSVAAHVAAEICRGLAYAHRRADVDGTPLGIVHRDISPQNILVSLSGEVKIADFGIAKTLSRMSDPEAGVIKGKYLYMSPEQAWGDPLGPATDVFSAGVVLWEMLTGAQLRTAKTVTALLDEVRDRPVPRPSVRRPAVPEALDAVVVRATAVEPADRFPDADPMADALEAFAHALEADPSATLRQILAEVDRPPDAVTPDIVPDTRDRAVTLASADRVTPPSATARFGLDDGRPTVAGRRSPASEPRSARPWLVVALTLGFAALGLWWLGGWL